ncbi:unnamed protein product [Plutella xylostella]|uniref:(diamondback moth) hypothetical protein n=1 Tax=Plutella xylostella TaxID=51655 RepID=A0A8S4EIB1_PLUXY|nr:unnamed protein product [Plutella xylostella]
MDKQMNPKILLNLLLLNEITLLANLLLILPANSTDHCESYDIVTHKFVGADDEVNDPLYLDSWDACTQKLKTNTNLLPHDISNLQGKTLRIATFTYKPYVILDLDETKYPGGYDGIDFKIITEFCRWINCTIQLIRDDENEWGDIFENGTSNGVIGNVLQDKADIGVAGLFSWYKPYVHLDFSAALVRSGVTCIAPAPRSIANWLLPLMAFDWVVWATVVFTLVYAAIALYLAKGCRSEKIMLTTFGMMVTQPQPDPGRSWRVRSVTGWLLVTGLLIDNAYGGGLAAAFTVPKYQGSIDTVQDLLDAKLPWGATHISWVFSMSASKDPKVIALVNQFRAMDEDELKIHSYLGTMAIAVEKLPAGNMAVHDFLTKEALQNLQLMVEDIYYEYTVIMARKNSQYVDKISQLAGRLHEAGLLLAWETQVAIEHLDFKLQLGVKYSRRKRETEIKDIDMKHVVKFISAFEKVNRLGNIRRGNKILLFLPMDKESDPKVFLDLLLLKEIALVANLLLIVPANSTENCESYDIVTHKFVGADAQANDPLYLDSWDACTQQLKTHKNLFPHDISNMHGKTLKLATFTYKPYVVLDLDNTTVPGGYDGLEMRVMAEFCRWVNCTLQIIRDDENEWGDIFEDGTGNGILGNVVEDRADFGIGALYSWHDSYVHLDFSASLVRSGITCVAPAPRIIASWELPLMAFSWPLWGTVAGTFVYAAAALYLASGCSSDKVLLTTFGMMVTQSQPESGVDWRTRSITGWLLVTGLLVDNAYGGGLAAAFTVPKYQGAVDTVQDMLDTRLEWGATHNAWIFSIQSSQDPRIIQLVSQFKTMEEEKLKRNSFLRTMALSIEKLPAGFFAIAEYITKEAMVNMQLMVEDIYYEYTVAMARKNSQYVDKLTQLAGRLHEAGLLQAWETQVGTIQVGWNGLAIQRGNAASLLGIIPGDGSELKEIFYL